MVLAKSMVCKDKKKAVNQMNHDLCILKFLTIAFQ